MVDQRGFADVGPADDRDSGRLIEAFLDLGPDLLIGETRQIELVRIDVDVGGPGKQRGKRLEQLFHPESVERRDRDQGTHAIFVEIGHDHRFPGGRVVFVDGEDRGFSGGPDAFDHIPIHGIEPVFGIEDIDQGVGLLKSEEGLFPDRLPQGVVIPEYDAAGVDKAIGPQAPEHGRVMAVPGHPRLVFDDGLVLPQ